MTAYADIDSDATAGSPVMLLEIVVGSGSGATGETFRYVNAPIPADAPGPARTFLPARMDRTPHGYLRT